MIWVEVFSRNHVMLARHRCAGPEIRIGRGYDNDVIIDDPYVAPRHVRIARSEAGVLVAEDLGSANGLLGDRSPHRAERIVVDGDRLIGIGHTYLRIREVHHAVAPERVVQSQARTGPILVALGAATLSMQAISLWSSDFAEPRLSRYLVPLLAWSFGALAWAAVWSTLSRVFSSHAGFERNLCIALAGVLLFVLGSEVIQFATFALSWGALATYWYVAMWGLLAVICFLHLRGISPSRLLLKGGAVAAVAVIAIATQMLMELETRSDFGQPNYVRRLMPPALRLIPPESESAFFAGAAQLRSKLDSDRTKEPAQAAIVPSFGFAK